MRDGRAYYNEKINYIKTTFGQRFLNYPGPHLYNTINLDLTKNII